MRLTFVVLALLAPLALSLSLAPAAAAPTPSGACYEVIAFREAAPDALWQGVLRDPDADGAAAFALTHAGTGETIQGQLNVDDVEWSLLVHAASASARAETWRLAEGETLRFAYTAEDGQPGPATGGGTAGGWTWSATARC